MKKLLLLSVFVLFAATAFAGSHQGVNPPPGPGPIVLDSSATPDAFGYRWRDSDGSGGPVFNWVDISSFGVPIGGLLQDDNNIGPVQLGFHFPYYWYTVDSCWIGSNGYISFSSNANFAHPFDSIPSPAQPNDLVTVLGGDLDFTNHSIIRPPAAYYYTNNVDTFIVSWINASQFSSPPSLRRDSTHTFQLILTKNDSTLTFQYGENHGRFSEDGNLQDIIGIENMVGRTGMEYLEDNLPSARLWHANLVIKFHPIPNPNFQYHDFGVVDGFHIGSGADLIQINQPYTIRGLVKNFGLQGEDNLRVRAEVRRGTSIIYTHTDTIAHLNASEQAWVEFATPFTPTEINTFKVTFTTIMTTPPDENSTNNTKTCELDSYQLPQALKFCDDLAESGRAWNGVFSGFGVEFQVPEPILVTSASMNIYSADSTSPAVLWVVPADNAGNPDLNNLLFSDTVTITAGQTEWVDVDLSSANLNFAANQKFFIVEIHVRENTMQFGMDTSVPLSYRGWEYTSGLSPDRDRQVSDVMIKIQATFGTGIEGEITPKSYSLSQNYPNPFNAQTNIRFSLVSPSDVSINIYNIAGQLVDNLSGRFGAGSNSVTWDASNIASGVYFYRINVGASSETKKMLLLK